MTGKISPRACGRRSEADNAPKAACAGDRGFETGQKTGAILENSRLNDSSKVARRRPLNRGCEKTRVMVGSWRMKAHNWQASGESRLTKASAGGEISGHLFGSDDDETIAMDISGDLR